MERVFAVKHHGHVIAFVAGTSVLAACGGGGSTVSQSGPMGNTPAQQVLTETAGNAAQALQDGRTLRASERTSSGITRDYNANTAAAAADTTATVMRNDAGALTLNVAGQTIDFAPGDLTEDGYGYSQDGAGIWAWSTDSMAEQLDPENGRDSLVFGYFANQPGDRGQNGFVVTGTETAAGDLAALPSASYSGWTRIRVAPQTGFEDFDDAVSELRGDLGLAANFGAGTVFGSVSNLQARLPRNADPTRSWSDRDGALSLDETAISGNGFSGSISADSAFTSGVASLDSGSSYSGTFFGTEAAEVAGGISMSGTGAESNAPFIGWGVFQGDKN